MFTTKLPLVRTTRRRVILDSLAGLVKLEMLEELVKRVREATQRRF